MVEHRTSVNKMEEKSSIYKYKRATKDLKLKFKQVENLATESIERPRRIVEAIHTKLTVGALNKTFDLQAC